MIDIERNRDGEAEYGDHLSRSQRVWDRWSNWYGMSERDLEPIRNRLIGSLQLEQGDDVLDIGCGPGVNFEAITDEIGHDGTITAIDYSPEMVERARERVDAHGWGHVTVVQADATTADLGGPYDVAMATLSLSVMPDIARAVRNIHEALAPGAILGVLDVQPFQSGLRRGFNPLLRRFLRWYANWNPDGDVRASIEDTFGGYETLETMTLGTIYVITAWKEER